MLMRPQSGRNRNQSKTPIIYQVLHYESEPLVECVAVSHQWIRQKGGIDMTKRPSKYSRKVSKTRRRTYEARCIALLKMSWQARSPLTLHVNVQQGRIFAVEGSAVRLNLQKRISLRSPHLIQDEL